MGNKNVYSDDHFITPNKINRDEAPLRELELNYENIFGKVDIPTARADFGDS